MTTSADQSTAQPAPTVEDDDGVLNPAEPDVVVVNLPTGLNGGIFVTAGLAGGEVVFASGGGSFSKTALPLTVDQANAILANPSGFNFNIHTARNPDGVARGQLIRVQ